jgi:hypothetical protein
MVKYKKSFVNLLNFLYQKDEGQFGGPLKADAELPMQIR